MRAAWILALGLASLSACGGSDGTGGPDGGCTVTLSGSLSGAYSCAAVAAVGTSGGVGFTLGTSPPAQGNLENLRFVADLGSGDPQAKTYGAADVVQASTGITTNALQVFAQSYGGITATTGSFGFAFSSVKVLAATPSGTSWTVHGTLQAVLPQAGAGGGSVTVRAQF